MEDEKKDNKIDFTFNFDGDFKFNASSSFAEIQTLEPQVSEGFKFGIESSPDNNKIKNNSIFKVSLDFC